MSAPFTMDASGKVTVLDSSWVDEDFVSADEEMTQTTYTQLRLGDQGQEVQNRRRAWANWAITAAR